MIKYLNENRSGIIFCLWGDELRKYSKYINKKTHYVLESGDPYPSDVKKGNWFGNNHFKKINTILEKLNGKDSCIEYC